MRLTKCWTEKLFISNCIVAASVVVVVIIVTVILVE